MGAFTDVPSAARRYLAGRSIRELALGGFLVALLFSGLFGGWQQAADDTPALSAGEPVVTEPVEVTVHGIATSPDVGEFLSGPAQGRYVAVVADISTSATSPIPSRDVSEVMRLRGVEGLFERFGQDRPTHEIPPRVVIEADRTLLADLGPGLTYRVWFVWEQREGAPAPASATVEVYGQTHRPSSIEGQPGWFDPTLIASATLPVGERPEAVSP